MPYTKPWNMVFHVSFSWSKRAWALGEWLHHTSVWDYWDDQGEASNSEVLGSTIETKIFHDRQELAGIGSSCSSPPNLHQVYLWLSQRPGFWWSVLHMHPLVSITIIIIHIYVVCSYQHKVILHTIDHIPLEEHFEAILGEIKVQPWYTNNPKLQEYIQNEWLDCQPVSTKYKILCNCNPYFQTFPIVILGYEWEQGCAHLHDYFLGRKTV